MNTTIADIILYFLSFSDKYIVLYKALQDKMYIGRLKHRKLSSILSLLGRLSCLQFQKSITHIFLDFVVVVWYWCNYSHNLGGSVVSCMQDSIKLSSFNNWCFFAILDKVWLVGACYDFIPHSSQTTTFTNVAPVISVTTVTMVTKVIIVITDITVSTVSIVTYVTTFTYLTTVVTWFIDI